MRGKSRGIADGNPRRVEFEEKEMRAWEMRADLCESPLSCGGLLESGTGQQSTAHIEDPVGSRLSFN